MLQNRHQDSQVGLPTGVYAEKNVVIILDLDFRKRNFTMIILFVAKCCQLKIHAIISCSTFWDHFLKMCIADTVLVNAQPM